MTKERFRMKLCGVSAAVFFAHASAFAGARLSLSSLPWTVRPRAETEANVVFCAGFAAASTAASGALTQAEVDHIVDNEIPLCEHEEDADAIEKDMKVRGVTDEMLAHIWACLSKSMRMADLPGDVREDIL